MQALNIKSASNSGFTLIEILVATMMASFLSLAVVGLTSQMSNSIKKGQTATFLRNTMEVYRSAVISTAGWEKTINRIENDQLRCLRATPSGNCITDLNPHPEPPAQPTGEIHVLMSADGQSPLFNDTDKNGFDFSGNACSGAPSESCPLELSFQAEQLTCQSDPCFNAGVMVEGILSTDPNLDVAKSNLNGVNLKNYSLRVSRIGIVDFEGFCENINGTWDQSAHECKFKTDVCNDMDGDGAPDNGYGNYMAGLSEEWKVVCTTQQCPPGKYVVSTADRPQSGSSGIPICQDISGILCAAGQRLAGMDAFGKPNCIDISPTGSRVCGVNEFFAGLDSNRQPICQPSLTCPNGFYAIGINPKTGTPECAPVQQDCMPGEVMRGFDSATGSRVCVPRPNIQCPSGTIKEMFPNGAFTCQRIDCAAGFVLRSVNADGTANCVQDRQVFIHIVQTEAGQNTELIAQATCPTGSRAVSCSCKCESGRMLVCGNYDLNAKNQYSCLAHCGAGSDPFKIYSAAVMPMCQWED